MGLLKIHLLFFIITLSFSTPYAYRLVGKNTESTNQQQRKETTMMATIDSASNAAGSVTIEQGADFRLGDIYQINCVGTGMFVSSSPDKTRQLVLAEAPENPLKTLFKLVHAPEKVKSAPGNTWLIESMYNIDRYICLNKRGIPYLGVLRKSCIFYQEQKFVTDFLIGRTFTQYKSQRKLVIKKTTSPSSKTPNDMQDGMYHFSRAPIHYRVLVTDMILKLYTSKVTLTDLLKSKLDNDSESPEAKVIDPIHMTLTGETVSISYTDWQDSHKYRYKINWIALVDQYLLGRQRTD